MLYRLQQIDIQLDQNHTRIREIETTLSGNDELKQAKDSLADIETKLESEMHALNKAEQAVTDQQFKIEQTESTLYSGKVRIPKELQDLQNEVAALKRHLLVLEDRLLDCMVSVESTTETRDKASTFLEKINNQWIEQTKILVNQSSHLEDQVLRLESERKTAITPIPQDLMIIYEQIRKQRNGIAVAIVSSKSCSACGTTLYPALLQAAQSAVLTRCPTCNRILYSG